MCIKYIISAATAKITAEQISLIPKLDVLGMNVILSIINILKAPVNFYITGN